jgi:hypothetical protein
MVCCAAYSRHGQQVVTASWDHTARVWNAQTGTERAVLRGHTEWVYSAAFSPDGRQVVTASEDHTARLWDAQTGAERAVLVGHTASVWSAEFSPDGRQVVTASEDHTARLWDAQTGAERAVLRGHTSPVYSADFSPDGWQVVTTSWDRTARLWDARTGVERAVLRGHRSPLSSAVFSPDGRQVVTASHDHTPRVWDAQSGAERAALRGHTHSVFSAAFSPDGRQIVTASDDGTACVWRRRSPEYQWGTFCLPEFWIALLSGGALIVIAVRNIRARSIAKRAAQPGPETSHPSSLPSETGPLARNPPTRLARISSQVMAWSSGAAALLLIPCVLARNLALAWMLLAAVLVAFLFALVRLSCSIFRESQMHLAELLLCVSVVGALSSTLTMLIPREIERDERPIATILIVLFSCLSVAAGAAWGWSAAQRRNETRQGRRLLLLVYGWLLVLGFLVGCAVLLTCLGLVLSILRR